jgi:PhnB protein
MERRMNLSQKLSLEKRRSGTPGLAVRNAAAAIEFYQTAFGATEVMRLTDNHGKIGYAEIEIGDARVTLADENPQYNHSPQSLGGVTAIIHLYVEDADAFVAQAVAAGAKVVFPVADQFYGDRSGRIEDPFGHVWIVAMPQEDVAPEEMQRRFLALCG